MEKKNQPNDRDFGRKSRKILNVIREWLKDLSPSPGAERGAALLVGVMVVIIGTYLGVTIRSGFGFLLDFIASLLASFIGYILVFLAIKVGWAILRKIPTGYIAALATGFFAALFFLDGIPWESVWYVALVIVMIEVLLGSFFYDFLKGNWRSGKRSRRIFMAICMIFFIAANLGLVMWMVDPGLDDYNLSIEPYRGEARVLESNPSEPGPYSVMTLFYGSGTDLRRSEYGENVDIITKSVDGSLYLWFDKWEGRIRELYWGFGPQELPLNGRVWYPHGEGPFPLTLVVHGNHHMIDYSEPGYEYLGELLASRGYIVVSIDENFLNGYLTGSVKWENDARAWLLLKHLEIWHEWNQTPGSFFEGLVDIEQIALIGHSRGGEAVALAAAFNHLSHYPDNANIRWNFNFSIQSVIAIAPVDQQYKPAGHPNQLTYVNYLILQGSHDADLSKYDGFRQYQRIHFNNSNSDKFKAGLYIYNANHSRFNSVWGLRDFSLPKGLFLNQQPLLSPESQRQIASLYISAFLESTLKGVEEYIPIFEDYRNAGNWLPPTLYVSQYQDAGYWPVAEYEEDNDVTTMTVEGGSISGKRLARWKEEEVKFRTGTSQNNHAVVLGWNRIGSWYQIRLPKDSSATLGLDINDHLVFNLADGRGLLEDIEYLDFTILLEDEDGNRTSILLSEVNQLLPQLPVQFTKLASWENEDYKNPTEIVFQTFRIPISTFLDVNPQFDLEKIKEIRFIFDQSTSGTIILDEIGFDLN
jgi:hypothetical protein